MNCSIRPKASPPAPPRLASAGAAGERLPGLTWMRLARREPGARRVAAAWTRWLGFIFFWALLALWFQMPGLTGPHGILPAGTWLAAVRRTFPSFWHRLWFAPSLLWLNSGTAAIHWLCGVGLAAALVMMLKWRPRWALAVCLLCFLSFIATAQVFADYQSDGMLMTAGLVTLFLDSDHPSWWSLFSLRWLWFTIYFGSGIAKLLSGDPEWRHLTALNHYFENGPLPTWLGWYVQQHLPHGLDAALALTTLALELGVAWLCFGPRRARIACFWLTTPFQVAIILTANYGFLNYLVLGLGLALLDDRHLEWLWGLVRNPRRALRRAPPPSPPLDAATAEAAPVIDAIADPLEPPPASPPLPWSRAAASLALVALFLVTAANLAHRLWSPFPAPQPVTRWLAPFRVADNFGLFAVMTSARYEIEFQGTADGVHWVAYPFRFKPQDPNRAPGVFGPYQPRFDWNLWFASLTNYLANQWVEETELRLLQNDPAVLSLFAGNPFARKPPLAVRAVRWQYWFATPAQHRQQGLWWTRKNLGLYTPELALSPRAAPASF